MREEVADAIRQRDGTRQQAIDGLLIGLDGTPDTHRVGANVLLGVSLACARAAAAHEGVELWRYLACDRAHVLPVPMLTVLEGGAHARNALDSQELTVVPWSKSCRHGIPARGILCVSSDEARSECGVCR